jgi:hypothetical protein
VLTDLAKRRFDIRIHSLHAPTGGPLRLTVETLSDHPYAGRRSWKLRLLGPPESEKHRYELETVELNTYPWLADWMLDVVTDSEDARATWERFLNNFTQHVGGTVVDDRDRLGVTWLHTSDDRATTLTHLRADPTFGPRLERAIKDYPELQELVLLLTTTSI